jgi:hypothetical protein
VGTALVVLGLGGGIARGDEDAELRELKETVRGMQQTIEKLNEKIERMERERPEKAAAPAPTPATGHAENVIAPQGVGPQATPMEEVVIAPPPINEEAAEGHAENVISSQGIGPQAPIDPKLRGFFRVPYTKAMIRFNAKPRVDFTYDTQNPGDDNRFVPALIPVLGDPNQGGGPVFNANSKGSQLIIDVRAPEMAGSPRFYYQNDFFGSGSAEFNYRLQQLYGSIYNVTVGQTFSPFEDPDIWPDTVDYEGPNSMIFARFPLVRYKLDLAEGWSANGGLTESNTQVSNFDGEPVSGVDHAPDFAFNLRGESADLGHIQFSTVFRDLGAKDPTFGTNSCSAGGSTWPATCSSRCRGSRRAANCSGRSSPTARASAATATTRASSRPTPRTTARVTSRPCPTSAASSAIRTAGCPTGARRPPTATCASTGSHRRDRTPTTRPTTPA